MNKQELNECYILRKEIAGIERAMRVLPAGDKRLDELFGKYNRKMDEFVQVIEKCEAQVERLPNSKLRCVFRMRYFEGRTWQEIADELGGHNTVDSVKKLVYRQLAEGEQNEAGR